MTTESHRSTVLIIAALTNWIYGISVPLPTTIAPVVMMSITLVALIFCFVIVFLKMKSESFQNRRNIICVLIGLALMFTTWLAAVASTSTFASVSHGKRAAIACGILLGGMMAVISAHFVVSGDFWVAKYLSLGGFMTLIIAQVVVISIGPWISLEGLFSALTVMIIGMLIMLAGHTYGLVLYNRTKVQRMEEVKDLA